MNSEGDVSDGGAYLIDEFAGLQEDARCPQQVIEIVYRER